MCPHIHPDHGISHDVDFQKIEFDEDDDCYKCDNVLSILESSRSRSSMTSSWRHPSSVSYLIDTKRSMPDQQLWEPIKRRQISLGLLTSDISFIWITIPYVFNFNFDWI